MKAIFVYKKCPVLLGFFWVKFIIIYYFVFNPKIKALDLIPLQQLFKKMSDCHTTIQRC